MRQRNEYNTLIVNTTEVTNYVTVNNYIVNRRVNVERVERASNRRFEAVEARSVMRREARVTQVTAGRQIEQRERRERPIPTNANAGNGNQNARQEIRDARQDADADRAQVYSSGGRKNNIGGCAGGNVQLIELHNFI